MSMKQTKQKHIFIDGDKLEVTHCILDGKEAWIFDNIYGLDKRFCPAGKFEQYSDHADHRNGVDIFAKNLGLKYEIETLK